MANSLAYVAILGWPVVVVVLFRRLPLHAALIWSVLAGYLFLPTRPSIDFPALPALDKTLVPSLAAAVMCLVLARRRTGRAGTAGARAAVDMSATRAAGDTPGARVAGDTPGARVAGDTPGARVAGDTPGARPAGAATRGHARGQGRSGTEWIVIALMGTLLFSPFLAVLDNTDPIVAGPLYIAGLRPYDAFSMALSAGVMLLPFVLGRRYLATPEAQVTLLKALVAAGLVYSLLILIEVRLSPQLNKWVYGYYSHSFAQHIRAGGFRPMVFVQHGLRVGIFMSACVLAAAVLWRVAQAAQAAGRARPAGQGTAGTPQDGPRDGGAAWAGGAGAARHEAGTTAGAGTGNGDREGGRAAGRGPVLPRHPALRHAPAAAHRNTVATPGADPDPLRGRGAVAASRTSPADDPVAEEVAPNGPGAGAAPRAGRAGRIPPGRWLLIAGWLLLALFLSKTLGAFAITLLLLPVAVLLSVRSQLIVAAVLAGVVLLYPMLRGAGLVPVDRIHAVAQSIDATRADSFLFRLGHEDALLERANLKPVLGWGIWGRNRIYDPRTGRDLSVSDGTWVIVIGSTGWVGYVAQFGLLTMPILLTFWKRRRIRIDPVWSGLCLILVSNLLDLIPNSGLTPVTWLIAGSLAGRLALGTAVDAPAHRGAATAARPSPRRAGVAAGQGAIA